MAATSDHSRDVPGYLNAVADCPGRMSSVPIAARSCKHNAAISQSKAAYDIFDYEPEWTDAVFAAGKLVGGLSRCVAAG